MLKKTIFVSGMILVGSITAFAADPQLVSIQGSYRCVSTRSNNYNSSLVINSKNNQMVFSHDSVSVTVSLVNKTSLQSLVHQDAGILQFALMQNGKLSGRTLFLKLKSGKLLLSDYGADAESGIPDESKSTDQSVNFYTTEVCTPIAQ